MSRYPVLWKDVRRDPRAHTHIKISLDGDSDRVMCLKCDKELPLKNKYRKADSIIRELARTHFYKHKLFEPFLKPAPPEPVDIGLFE